MPEAAPLAVPPGPNAATIDAALDEAAREVLETMFFLTLEGGAVWPGAGSHVAIDFHGPIEGRMDLAVSSELAPMLASAFTGRDEAELTPADIEGVLCEMANMLCGSVLSRVEPDALFSLSTPRPAEREAGAPGVCRVYDLGPGAARVCVSLFDPAARPAE